MFTSCIFKGSFEEIVWYSATFSIGKLFIVQIFLRKQFVTSCICSLFNKILSISATNFHIYTQGLSSPIIYNGNEFLFATGSTDNQHQRLQLSFLFMKDLSKVCASQNCYIIIFFCFYWSINIKKSSTKF